MKKAVIDLETLSSIDLKKVGVKNYAAHKETGIRCIAIRYIDGPACGIINPKITGEPLSQEAKQFLKQFAKELYTEETKLIAHNYAFEMNILNYSFLNFLLDCDIIEEVRELTHEDFMCTAALSRMCRGNGSLEKAAEFHGLKLAKDKEGNRLMKATALGVIQEPSNIKGGQICKRKYQWNKIGEAWYKTSLEIEEEVLKYCKMDTMVCYKLYKLLTNKLKRISGEFLPEVLHGFRANCRMNERGACFDKGRANLIKCVNELSQKTFDDFSLKHFNYKGNQKAKIMRYLGDIKYDIAGLGAPDIAKAALDPNNDPEITKLLQEYTSYNRSSLKKAKKGMDICIKDTQDYARLYDSFIYCGASVTGRWAGSGFQLQNLPSPSHTYDQVQSYFDLFNGLSCKKEIDADIAQSALRTLITADPGETLFIADLAQIECRLALWTAGHGKEVKEMSEGRDLYSDLASKIYRKPVKKGDKERDIGKAAILAFQFGQGAKAFKNQVFNLKGIEISERFAEKCHAEYHKMFPGIEKQWNTYSQGAKVAYANKKPFSFKLATGRILEYGKIYNKYVDKGYYKGYEKQYKKAFQNSIIWDSVRRTTPFQHKIQGEARDILLMKFNDMDRLGYKIVMTVHDEVVISIPKDKKEQAAKDWEKAGMDKINKYFSGLSIQSDVEYRDRYFK